MENEQKILSVEAGDWGADAAELLQVSVRFPVAWVGRQVERGEAKLFRVFDADRRLVSAYVLRVDEDEGVIVAAAGKWKGGSLLQTVLPYIERQFIGVKAIRMHTARPGLCRQLVKMGYAPQEIVMRKDHGQ